ncbi:Uncharacterized protein APZ42_012076 [Daphnia magna]|uniref:Uncharacterized protein n=1 Tax=Daphnia magna TaxID=35525 RepID=A0A162S111_9CRUS|nr:Uncharacterized protein APZ42_012076 [Daphnia magna]
MRGVVDMVQTTLCKEDHILLTNCYSPLRFSPYRFVSVKTARLRRRRIENS